MQDNFKITFASNGPARPLSNTAAPGPSADAEEARKRRRRKQRPRKEGDKDASAREENDSDSGTPAAPAKKVHVAAESRPQTARPQGDRGQQQRHSDARPKSAAAPGGGHGHPAAAALAPAVHAAPAPHAAGAGAAHAHGAHAHHGHHPHHQDHHSHAVPAAPTGTSAIDERFLSTLTWTDPAIGSRLSAPTMRALTEIFRFQRLSKVQAATLPGLLEGKDVFAKAKTGAGKTLSFLIPAVEQLMKAPAAPGHRIGILVVSPTRELAQQILAEALNLLKFNRMTAMTVIGGTNINGEKQRMTHNGRIAVDILVATPGRCVDHLESTPGFAQALAATRVLVLDEADRLLDMGFKPQLDKIIGALPPSGAGRQTMLFSATVPEGVKQVALRCMRAGYAMVDTVGNEEPQTNASVYQEVLVVPSTSVVPALTRTLAHIARSDPNHKVIVFFTTARITGYLAGIFEKMPIPGSRPGAPGPSRFNIVEMHSRKSQGYRTSAAERFRTAKGIFMFSSDVTARGMDYPDITHVVQVGLTDRESYIHRVGRTARAGKSGAGIIILADYEAGVLLHDLREIPLQAAEPTSILTGGASNGVVGNPTRGAVSGPVAPPAELAHFLAAVPNDKELRKESLQAYSATLGYYNSHLRKLRWEKSQLASEVNALMLTLGLPEIPLMSRETLGKMGLRGTPGLREAPKGWKPGDGEDL